MLRRRAGVCCDVHQVAISVSRVVKRLGLKPNIDNQTDFRKRQKSKRQAMLEQLLSSSSGIPYKTRVALSASWNAEATSADSRPKVSNATTAYTPQFSTMCSPTGQASLAAVAIPARACCTRR